MKIYSFSQARFALAMPPDKMWDKIKRDFTHIPQDTVDAIEEWKDMYEQYSSGEGITDTIRNTFADAIAQTFQDMWYFTQEYFYYVALFGGLIAFALYLCGHKGSLKWVTTLVVAYVAILALGAI